MSVSPPHSFPKLKVLLSEITGNEIDDITVYSHLEDDLGVNLHDEFRRIVAQINLEFEISLNKSELLDELSETGETVGELAKLIDEECELG